MGQGRQVASCDLNVMQLMLVRFCNHLAVQQRQVTGNTHVFDRPRASASVSSALLTELNTTLNCLKVQLLQSFALKTRLCITRATPRAKAASSTFVRTPVSAARQETSRTTTSAAWRRWCSTRSEYAGFARRGCVRHDELIVHCSRCLCVMRVLQDARHACGAA